MTKPNELFASQQCHLCFEPWLFLSSRLSLLCCGAKKSLCCNELDVNFTKTLWAAFHFLRADLSHSDPKRAKRQFWLDCLFALLGSVCAKAARKCWWNELGLSSLSSPRQLWELFFYVHQIKNFALESMLWTFWDPSLRNWNPEKKF